MFKGRISDNSVSLFSNAQSIQPIEEVDLIQWLMSYQYKDQVMKIRQTDNKQIRQRLKSKLPCITPSGVFSQRCKNGLVRHSGLIGIDIDTPISHKNGGLINLKTIASKLPCVAFACDSVGGFGSFWLIPINDPRKHTEYYRAISAELHELGIAVDNSCSDVSRLRYATYDPTPYINTNAESYELPTTVVVKELTRGLQTPCITTEPLQWQASTGGLTTSRVDMLVGALVRSHIDMTDNYRDWYAIGQSLASEFGERGRDYFHAVSRQSTKYHNETCNAEYAKCLRNCNRVGISTFFWYCKVNGLTTKSLNG